MKISTVSTGNRKSFKARLYFFPLLGFFFMSLLVSAEVFWEYYGREMFLYQEIIVPKQDIKRGTIINQDMFKRLKVEKDKIIDKAVIDETNLLGLEAKQFIPKNSQISELFFESPKVMTTAEQFNWKIPNEWIISAPNTLRRKDEIIIYEVPEKAINKTLDANKKVLLDSKSGDDIDAGKYLVDRKKLMQVTVTYVKDAVNREVVSTSVIDRLDASSVMKDIEVIMTVGDVTQLTDAIGRGSKLMIGYTEEKGAKEIEDKFGR